MRLLLKINQLKSQRYLYYILILCVVFNAIIAAFDNNKLLRETIPFASGFSFSRFEWLSPFFWIVLLALSIEFLINTFQRIGSLFAILLIASGVWSIAFDPQFTSTDSMYNNLDIQNI